MNTYIIIGAPGQGKSPFVKRFIEGNRCFVFDIQNEYGQRTKYAGQSPVGLSNNINDLRARYTGIDMDEFIRLCGRKQDTICVFEEATAFFEGKTGKIMRRHLINRFHTRNVSLLIFHSINSVPPRIMEMSNYVVLFKTLDEDHTVAAKFGRLFPYYKDLQEQPDGSSVIIKLL